MKAVDVQSVGCSEWTKCEPASKCQPPTWSHFLTKLLYCLHRCSAAFESLTASRQFIKHWRCLCFTSLSVPSMSEVNQLSAGDLEKA